MMDQQTSELIEFDEWLKLFPTKADAARKLDVDWSQLNRWFQRKSFADRNSRKLAAQKGVSLPVRP